MTQLPCAHCGGSVYVTTERPYGLISVECPSCNPAPPIQVSPLASEADPMAIVRDARERRATLERLSEIVVDGDPDAEQIEEFQSVLAKVSHDVPALCNLIEAAETERAKDRAAFESHVAALEGDKAHLNEQIERMHDAANKAAILVQGQANEIARLREYVTQAGYDPDVR